ncbi:MAG TPA: hypothetical protein VN673_16565 [Clostridia bacterium]|nr:hypothetical protein [Clostridia bacterium]
MSPNPDSKSIPSQSKPPWKQRLVRELIKYWINVVYLAVFFGAFAWYRRLILAEYRISYLHYGVAIFEALVLAKVILVGSALGLSRGLEGKPLILPTLFKAAVFTVFVGLFAVLEHMTGGLLHGKGLAGGFQKLLSEGKDELLARCLVTFFAFLPFFAFQELGQALGEGKLRALFFKRGAFTTSGPPSGSSG